jgi:TrmH family RNA methyltransferase
VRDPGNVGTLIRTAEALGARGAIVSGHSVDPFNPKTLRATAGAIFHLPVAVATSLSDVTEWVHRAGGEAWATVVRGGEDLTLSTVPSTVAVVLGNEGAGLSEDDVALCDRAVTIAMAGRSESLNVAVAGALALYVVSARGTEGPNEGPTI